MNNNFFFGLLFLPSIIQAQPNIQWQKAFGGSSYDGSNSIVQTADNGYIAAGQSASDDGDVTGNHGGWDFWVVKMDSFGIAQWKKSYGGSNNDWAYAIKQTVDGGYVVVGFTESNDGDVSGNHGDKDMWVLKLASDGAIQWQKTLGGSGWEDAWSVNQTDDDGYIVAGRSGSTDGDVTENNGYLDYWVVKLNNSGDIEWQKSLGGSGLDLCYAVNQTNDGGYIISGESDSQDGDVKNNHGNSDYWIVKLNFEGKIEWENSFGGTGIDRSNDIRQTSEGGYIVFGQTRSINGDVTGNHGVYDCWVLKLDGTGELEWQKTLGGSNEDYGQSIQQISDGSYLLSGITASNDGDVWGNHGNLDAWVVKLNEEGSIQWQMVLGAHLRKEGISIQATNDGGYIMAGEAWSNNGDVSGVHGKTDFWVAKLSTESTGTTELKSATLEIFSQPSHETILFKNTAVSDDISTQTEKELIIKICITDLMGREFYQISNLDADMATIQIDISTLPNGLYLLSATMASGKVIAGRFGKE